MKKSKSIFPPEFTEADLARILNDEDKAPGADLTDEQVEEVLKELDADIARKAAIDAAIERAIAEDD